MQEHDTMRLPADLRPPDDGIVWPTVDDDPTFPHWWTVEIPALGTDDGPTRSYR